MKPLMFINFKTYKEGTGKKALELAKICEKIAKKNKFEIILAVQAADIYRISKNTKLKVIAQHIDDIKQGQFTGYILAEDIKEDGAYGTLLNHSEHPLNYKTLKNCIKIAKETKLKTFVFAKNIKEIKKFSLLKPDYIVIEPPELVGGDISVSKAKPKLIRKSVLATKLPVLCGAGIKTKEDVVKALELGVIGIGLSSGILKAKNPGKVLREITNI